MVNGMTELEFITHPDTVDFIVKKDPFFERFVAEHPEILMAKLIQGQYWLGYIHRDDFPILQEGLGNSFISSVSRVLGLLSRPALESSGIVQVHQQPYLSLKGNGVLIGVVDTGIDYTKDAFIYDDGTSKIQSIYDQTATGQPPEGFVLGAEYTNEQINQALRSDDPFSIVPQRDTSGHGTFLASVAAGREIGDFIGAAPEAELIIVKLRKARNFYLEKQEVPENQEYAFGSSAVMMGIEYILEKNRQLNRPVVIFLGVGTNFGGHDGFSIFEEYLSGIASLRGVCLCTAIGNESQARHHTQGKLITTGEQQNIDLKVGEAAGNIFINIWNTAADRFSVSIRSPTGELVNRVPAKSGSEALFPLILEQSKVGVEYFFPIMGSGSQLTIIRIRDPTPGIWTITLYGDIVLDGTYHAWLPITGFVSPNVEFLASSPYYTAVIPSTMFGSIVCGAYDSSRNSLYSKTSWGPTRLPELSPDLVAPGVNILGKFPYGNGRMDGTSVAAAVTAGACALLMEWGVVKKNDPSMSTYQIRAYLLRGCSRSDAMTYPNNKWGYGTLNLIQSFNLMREL